jgi:DNA-binding transcriptional regulator YiaG
MSDIDTPEGFKAARERLGLTQSDLARILGLGTDGGRTVRRWEAPEDTSNSRPPHPAAVAAMRWMLDGFRPPGWPDQAHDATPR